MKLTVLIVIVLTLFCFTFNSCNKDDENIFSDATIDSNYITWHKTNEIQKGKDICVSQKDKPYLLTTPNSFSLENFSFSTKFRIKNIDESLSILIGKELAYMQVTDKAVSFWANSSYDEEPLSFYFQTNIEYALKVCKTATNVKFQISEDETVIYEKVFSIYTDHQMVLMRGKPVFMLEKGNIHIIHSKLETIYDKKSTVNVFGDSFIEGVFLISNGVSLDSRWVAQLGENIQEEKCLIDGQGGEKMSEDFINRVMYINSIFKSKYVLLSIGTNNYSDVNRCIDYMKTITNKIKQNNQIPIFATVTPRQTFDYNNTAKKINDWIKSSGELFVDMHKSVTKEDNPTEWKDGYVYHDKIHPTVIAYEAMFMQLKNDCPFLFSFK